MLNFLFAKNKVGYIDGRTQKPEDKSSNYMPLMRCDEIVKGWLTTAMEKNIRSSVKYANTTSQIRVDLQERFGKESAPRAYELKKSLTSTHKEGMLISAYYTKLRGVCDDIQLVSPSPWCTCNKCDYNIGKRLNEAKENEILYGFLMGLNGKFNTIRTQILFMKPTPILKTAYCNIPKSR